MQHTRPRGRNDYDGQLRLDLQDQAPRFGPDANDWTLEAEPDARQPLHGHQHELFPRVPADDRHA